MAPAAVRIAAMVGAIIDPQLVGAATLPSLAEEPMSIPGWQCPAAQMILTMTFQTIEEQDDLLSAAAGRGKTMATTEVVSGIVGMQAEMRGMDAVRT